MLKERLTNTHWSTHTGARRGVFPQLPLCLAAKFGKLGAAELKKTAWERICTAYFGMPQNAAFIVLS